MHSLPQELSDLIFATQDSMVETACHLELEIGELMEHDIPGFKCLCRHLPMEGFKKTLAGRISEILSRKCGESVLQDIEKMLKKRRAKQIKRELTISPQATSLNDDVANATSGPDATADDPNASPDQAA